jgi:D-alanyl-lipoteichoic acid acyltransferase DltB (MBOAT superfamily)
VLFNSQIFIFAFLPVVVAIYGLLGKFGGENAKKYCWGWLVAASLFFYGWWNPPYLLLLITLTCANFWLSLKISRTRSRNWLTGALAFNILILGYFKYTMFIAHDILAPLGYAWEPGNIILPLAISFFTFQKIAYLVDCYRGEVHDPNFLHFALFVTFFPQLIAGPIVHHKEVMPQFDKKPARLQWDNIAIGLTIFFIGLFKKVVIADGIAQYSTPVFTAAEAGETITFLEGWGAALAYTFQIYFDFSGYSDMAIGLARIFGIILPLNFFSPYKATNIIEFWRRWHITLSRFLRDYLYIPLGGNRKGELQRYRNLIITMLLGGIWHGAAWTFLIWGAMHGVLLAINHLWRRLGIRLPGPATLKTATAWLLTFTCVVVAWVFFRADSVSSALSILYGMAGINGLIMPDNYKTYLNHIAGLGNVLSGVGIQFAFTPYFYGFPQMIFSAALLAITLLAPSTALFMQHQNPVLWPKRPPSDHIAPTWKPTLLWCFAIGLLAVIALLSLHTPNEFLYFNF